MADMIKVRSATNRTISLYDPTIPLRKVWSKRDAVYPIEREKLMQVYFNSSLEKLLRQGLLIIDDKKFLVEVGYLLEENEPITTIELTPALMKRCISVMSLIDLKDTLSKLSIAQINDLVAYAVEHNDELRMDRIDILSQASGKNILRAIELHKKDQED